MQDFRSGPFPETDLLLGDGRFLEAVGENYRTRNGRFHSGKVVVSGARGETVAFMLALEAEAQPVPGLGVVINPPNGIRASLAAPFNRCGRGTTAGDYRPSVRGRTGHRADRACDQWGPR